jgi:hypothetical protein
MTWLARNTCPLDVIVELVVKFAKPWPENCRLGVWQRRLQLQGLSQGDGVPYANQGSTCGMCDLQLQYGAPLASDQGP